MDSTSSYTDYSNSIDTVNESQDEEKQALAKRILALYERSKNQMAKKHRLWKDNYEFFLGKQWPTSRPAYRSSEVLNYTFAAVQSALPILTDNRPRFSYFPEDPNDQELGEYFEKIAASTWNREGWNLIAVDLYLTGMIMGTSFPSMKYDPNSNSGLGKIKFLSVDPFQLYFDDSATDINDGSCSFVIQAVPMPVSKVKAMFPELADKIQADLSASVPSKYSQESIDGTDSARVINFPTTKTSSEDAYLSKSNLKDRVMVYEFWADDDTLTETECELKDDNGQPLYGPDGEVQKGKEVEKKFPDGRHTIVVNGLIAVDENNPYKDGKYPYARYVDYQLPQEFYGMGDIDQLKGPQRMINRAVCSFLDNMTYMGNPIWIMDTGAADADLLTNAPGLIVEKTPNSDIRREPGLPLPAGSAEIYNIAAGAFDRIFGSNEVSQGVRVPGVTSGVAIESLQEAAQTRLRLKARNMEVTLTQIGEMFLSRVMQFWTQPQFVSVTNEGMPPEVFQFQIEKDPEQPGWYSAMVQPYAKNNAGQMKPTAEQKQFRTKGIFDVRVTVGSNLPFAKKEKADRALQFFQLGLVDAEEVFKATEWPGWERVLARMKDSAQQQALMASQSGQQEGKPQ
jgi:hypothetical protein